MSDEMDGLVAELREQLVEIENVIREVIVAAGAGPFGLAVTSPIERCDTVPRRDQIARDGIEAPSDVQEAVAEHHVYRSVTPTNDVKGKTIRGELSLGRCRHLARSSNLCGESACACLDEPLPAIASEMSSAVSGASRIPFL